jgi:hypothetical protein
MYFGRNWLMRSILAMTPAPHADLPRIIRAFLGD